MPHRLMIRDIAVVAEIIDSRSPSGEASNNSGVKFLKGLTEKESKSMLARLESCIHSLMMIAEEDHQNNFDSPLNNDVDLGYITRLSTNEFFFYTQEPLTLMEFQN